MVLTPVNLEMVAEYISRNNHVVFTPIDRHPVHAEILREEGFSVTFHNVWMILLQQGVHLFHFFTCQRFDNKQFVTRLVKLGSTLPTINEWYRL